MMTKTISPSTHQNSEKGYKINGANHDKLYIVVKWN